MSHPIPGHVYGENEKEDGEVTERDTVSRFRSQEDDPYHDNVVLPFEQAREDERRDDYERHAD